jgi:transcriptional regulator with XRE-family HTH domain
MLGIFFKNKTIKELRKNQGLTAKELALIVKMDTVEILRIDNMKFKNLPESMKKKLFPYLSGSISDKIPWL